MSNKLGSTESDWPLRSSEMPIGSMENSAPYTPELGEMPTGSMSSENSSMSSENMVETPARSPGEMPLGKMDQRQPSAENTMSTGNMEGGGTVTAMADAAAGGGEMPLGRMDSGSTPSAIAEMPAATADGPSSGLNLSGRWRISIEFDA
jgi:hypothetical protein